MIAGGIVLGYLALTLIRRLLGVIWSIVWDGTFAVVILGATVAGCAYYTEAIHDELNDETDTDELPDIPS